MPKILDLRGLNIVYSYGQMSQEDSAFAENW
jgi:hypothetical protein